MVPESGGFIYKIETSRKHDLLAAECQCKEVFGVLHIVMPRFSPNSKIYRPIQKIEVKYVENFYQMNFITVRK